MRENLVESCASSRKVHRNLDFPAFGVAKDCPTVSFHDPKPGGLVGSWLASMQVMDLPIVSNNMYNMHNNNRGNGVLTHPKPDSTVPSPPSDPQNPQHGPQKVASASENGGHELADLSSAEISLDLQGLIDDAHFGADAEGLFGDLMEAGHKRHHEYARLSPVNSLASSSPEGHHQDFTNVNYRSNLAYLPGSVHMASATSAAASVTPVSLPSMTSLGNAVFVKQEPASELDHLKRHHHALQQQQPQQPHNTYVSSTTAFANMNNNSGPPRLPNNHVVKPFGGPKYAGSSASSVASTASTPGGGKKRVDRNSDEYRRRRERNNVAVRKSREKAKARTRETEDRVKILVRENERLQKKVELLQEELSVLRSLFSNVGVLPDHIHRELSKHIDNFQQQHNAMACM